MLDVEGTVTPVSMSPPGHGPAPELGEGQRLGEFQILRWAGSGGYGVVYRALDVGLDRLVAVKVLTKGAVEPYRSRFRREAILASKLEHPNVVKIFAWRDDLDPVCLVMQWVEGADLRTLVDKGGPLPPDRAVRLLRQAASALDAAHAPEKGVVHRDVKPQNLLVADPGGAGEKALLTDFGLSASSTLAVDVALSYEGRVGTPDYMSPEQAAEKGLDWRTDLYSLAAVAMFALTGRPLFPDRAEVEVGYAHIHEPPPSAHARIPALPMAVDAVFAAGLAKDPADRPGSCREFVDRLDAALTASVPNPVTRLPVPLTSLAGRGGEIEALRLLLGAHRLVTVTGPGGVGKSRLALAAVDDRRRTPTPTLVELAPLTDPTLLPLAVASVLKIVPSPDQTAHDAVLADLQANPRLLILDNCEHLLDAVESLLSDVLATCPGVSVLATSRAPLGLLAEQLFPLGPLPVPRAGDPARALRESASVELFVSRAAAAGVQIDLHGPEAAAVGAICRHLDGIPLAIDLAARRTRVLTPTQIAERLDDALGLPAGGDRGTPDRHRTLAATLQWTYGLLDADEQAGFRWLSVFAGGFGLDAAEAVLSTAGGTGLGAGLDVLTELVDWSLVARDPDVPGRHRMLEIARAFAAALLSANPAEEVQARTAHLQWCTGFVQAARDKWTSAQAEAAAARVETEIDNVRGALTFAESPAAPAGSLLPLAAPFVAVTARRASSPEARSWAEKALKRPGGDEASRLLAQLGLATTGCGGDSARARAMAEEALSGYSALGDHEGVFGCRVSLAARAGAVGDDVESHSQLSAALDAARAAGSPLLQSWALANLASLVCNTDPDRAHRLLTEALALARQAGTSSGEGWVLTNLGLVALRRGERVEAERELAEAERIFAACGDRRCLAITQVYRAAAVLDGGDVPAARHLLIQALRVVREDSMDLLLEILDALADVCAAAGEHRQAARLEGAVTAGRAIQGCVATGMMRARHETAMTHSRDALGTDVFDAARAAGAQLELGAIVAALIDQGGS